MSATVGTAPFVDVKVGTLDAAKVCVGLDVVWERPVVTPPGGKAAVVVDSFGEGTSATLNLPDITGRKYIGVVVHQGNRDATIPAGASYLGSGAGGLDNNSAAGASHAETSIFHWVGAGGTKTYSLASSGSYAWVVLEVTAGDVDPTLWSEAPISWATRTSTAPPPITGTEPDDILLLITGYRRPGGSTTADDAWGMDLPWVDFHLNKNTTGTHRPAIHIGMVEASGSPSANEAPVLPADHSMNVGLYVVGHP